MVAIGFHSYSAKPLSSLISVDHFKSFLLSPSRARIKGTLAHLKTTTHIPAAAALVPMSRFVFSVFLLLLLLHSYSDKAQGVENVAESPHRFHAEPTHRFHKMNVRKLLLEDALLEYDYGGPNTRHDPKKGKPGAGKNP